MNKTTSIIISSALVIVIGIIFIGGAKLNKKNPADTANTLPNISMKDGVQYINIEAKGGYSPIVTDAQGGIPTKLIVKTDGTYDCSASLTINSIGYRKVLKQTGEEVIDLGIPKSGVPLNGTCGMGMYSFIINFK